MASTWSALKVELQGTGENSGTWGTLTNANLGDAVLGEAITGSATVNFATAADVTITLTDVATSQSARNLRLNITESATGIGYVGNLILGSGCQIEKFYLINNTGTGAKTVKNTTGTGISVPAGKATLVFNDGTNVVDGASYFTSLTLGSALPVASGGTGLTAGTSGGVLAYTASGTLASSGALTANSLVIGGGAGAAPSTTTTGTGVVTALGVAVGTAGAFVVNGGVLGTPSSGTLTNCTFPTLNQNTTGTAANVTGIVAAVNGGTGQSSYAVGDIIYASTTTALSKLADIATGNALITGGIGVAPSYGKIGLTTHVSGNLPVTNLNSGTSASASTFWRGDGTWAAAGTGSVTSVAQSFTGGLISVAGSPVTTSGTLALTVAGTSGGIPYFSSASTWATSAALTQYGVVYGGGAGATPVATAAGTTGQVLTATTGGAPTWAAAAGGGSQAFVAFGSTGGF